MLTQNLLDETLDLWYEAARKRCHASEEWKYYKTLREQVDSERTTQLNRDQNDCMDEWLMNLDAVSDAESRALYLAGVRDCAGLLRRILFIQ